MTLQMQNLFPAGLQLRWTVTRINDRISTQTGLGSKFTTSACERNKFPTEWLHLGLFFNVISIIGSLVCARAGRSTDNCATVTNMHWKPITADFEPASNNAPYLGAEMAPGWLARIRKLAGQFSMDVMHRRLTQGVWLHVGALKNKALAGRCFEEIVQGRRPVNVAGDPGGAFERLHRTQSAYRDHQHGVVMIGGIFHSKNDR